ncbi:MAG: V-type ATP synthase subunit I [Candidatus Hadarchaeales archaeon]
MRRFKCVFLKSECERVVGALHEAGVVQLREVSDQEFARMALGEEINEVSSLLSRFKEMEELLGPAPRSVAVREMGFSEVLALARRTGERFWPRISSLRERMRSLEAERSKLVARQQAVRRLADLGAEMECLRSTGRVWIGVGEIAEENLSGFISEMRSSLLERVVVESFGSGRRRLVLMACLSRDRERVSPLLYRYEVELLEVPEVRGAPYDVMRELEDAIREIDFKIEEVRKAIQRISRKHGARIAAIRELLEIQRERLDARRLFGRTESTVVIEGWVPGRGLERVERVLAAATGGKYVLRSYEPTGEEVESVPSKFENPPGISNFEYITKMYGMPKYREADPTPVLSFTFPIFFAIALSDAGYGLALALFMASGVWIAKAFPMSLRKVMVVSGICAVVAGLLVGGWFGLGEGAWVNPIERPVPLLKLTIFIGIAHLLLGLGLTGVLKDIFNRNWRNIAFERLSKVLLLLGFFGLSFCILGIGLYEFGINFSFPKVGLFDAFNPLSPAPGTVAAFRLMFYSGLALGVAGAAVGGSGVRGKVGGAVNSVYGITGLIADVTSYCRLLALCIASGVIAFSINFILGFIWNGIAPAQINPLTAVYICVLAIAFGFMFFIAHSFNIFLNSLGAFVHTLRLHFAEFFSKFYEGGGEEFKPFAVKRSITRIKGAGAVGR